MVLSDRGAAVVQISRATEPNAPEINLFSPDQNIPDRGPRRLPLDLKAPAGVAAALRTKTRGRTSRCVTRRHLRSVAI